MTEIGKSGIQSLMEFEYFPSVLEFLDLTLDIESQS